MVPNQISSVEKVTNFSASLRDGSNQYILMIPFIVSIFRSDELRMQMQILETLKNILESKSESDKSKFAALLFVGRLLAEVPSSCLKMEEAGLLQVLLRAAQKNLKRFEKFNSSSTYFFKQRKIFLNLEIVQLIKNLNVSRDCPFAHMVKKNGSIFPVRSKYIDIHPSFIKMLEQESEDNFSVLKNSRNELLVLVTEKKSIEELREIKSAVARWTRTDIERLEISNLMLTDPDVLEIIDLHYLRGYFYKEVEFQEAFERLVDSTLTGSRKIEELAEKIENLSREILPICLREPGMSIFEDREHIVQDGNLYELKKQKLEQNKSVSLTSVHDFRITKSGKYGPRPSYQSDSVGSTQVDTLLEETYLHDESNLQKPSQFSYDCGLFTQDDNTFIDQNHLEGSKTNPSPQSFDH